MKQIFLLLAAFVVAACTQPTPQQAPEPISDIPLGENQETAISNLMETHKAPSLAIGIIKNGVLTGTRYFGEQAPGVPLSAQSMFNTASVHKAITAETVIRLVEKGLINLDEPLSPHYVHPDIAADPRHEKLTPRIVLTHKTGFRNWPYEYDDGKLAFDNDPGEAYGYSGIGFMILARAIEAKLEKPWPQIVREEIYNPLGMVEATTIQEPWMAGNYVIPVDEKGAFKTDFELAYGYWNAADDLYITVKDMAKFLIAVLKNQGISDALAAERIRVQSDLTNNPIWGCDGVVDPCPAPYGHGLGWFVFGYDGNINVQHGGNDRSEAAIAYIELQTGDGAIVFVNSPQGVLLWPKVVEIVDEQQQFTPVFNHIIAKFLTPEE
ncbi:MAG: serine hydrolase domain-containing protein [Bacteroidota bacterium]